MSISERFSLTGRVIVLTGATGRYGRGLVADLAATGAHLVVASRDPQRARLAAEEQMSLGRQVWPEVVDQGDEISIRRLCTRVIQLHGRIDGVVNNAVAPSMATPESPLEDWDASLRVNGAGMMLMHRIFGNALRQNKSGGSIINIGSIHGTGGPMLSRYEGTDHAPPTPDYFFHKGGLLNLTRYYAALFGPSGVRVNCVSPGGFYHAQSTDYVARYSAHTFLRRMANSTDLGGAVIFLLSDASAYITGANLPVDGGYSAA